MNEGVKSLNFEVLSFLIEFLKKYSGERRGTTSKKTIASIFYQVLSQCK